MKRQRGKARSLYRCGRYRGRRSGEIRLTAAAVCAALGLVLVVIRGLGIRFSGFLLLGAAALLVLSWLLDRLAAGNARWLLVRRGFYGCVAVGLALLVGGRAQLAMRGCHTGPANCFLPPAAVKPLFDAPLFVRLRYRQRPVPAEVRLQPDGCLHIRLDEAQAPHFPSAPGQIAAVYHKGERRG